MERFIFFKIVCIQNILCRRRDALFCRVCLVLLVFLPLPCLVSLVLRVVLPLPDLPSLVLCPLPCLSRLVSLTSLALLPLFCLPCHAPVVLALPSFPCLSCLVLPRLPCCVSLVLLTLPCLPCVLFAVLCLSCLLAVCSLPDRRVVSSCRVFFACMTSYFGVFRACLASCLVSCARANNLFCIKNDTYFDTLANELYVTFAIDLLLFSEIYCTCHVYPGLLGEIYCICDTFLNMCAKMQHISPSRGKNNLSHLTHISPESIWSFCMMRVSK